MPTPMMPQHNPQKQQQFNLMMGQNTQTVNTIKRPINGQTTADLPAPRPQTTGQLTTNNNTLGKTMTRILIIFSIIISIPNISFAAVVDTCPTPIPDTEESINADNCNVIPGCYWVEGSCEKCPDGKYGAGCTGSCRDPFINSRVGATDINECYDTCPSTKKIPNGQITYPDKVFYNDKKETQETCDTHKQIICDRITDDPCLSFHVDGDNCVISWRGSETEKPNPQIDNCKEYLQYYTSFWNTTRNCLTCKEGYSLKESESVIMPDPKNKCGIINEDVAVGRECMIKTIECATALKEEIISAPDDLSKRKWVLSDQKIQGVVEWDSTQYNYSNCSGEYTGTNDYGETKPITCTGITYDPNSNKYRWNECRLGTSTGCPDGKCIMPMPGESDCGDAHRGYYAESNNSNNSNNIKCQACPGGTTTNGTGKKGKSACQIKIGGTGTQTEFCDSTGKCFQLNRTDQQYPQYFDIKF